MTSRQRLTAALRCEPVDRIPISPRIWAWLCWQGLNPREGARRLGYDCVLEGGGVFPVLHDPEARQLPPGIEVNIHRRREGATTLYERTFSTPGGRLHDALLQADGGREYGIGPNPEIREPLVKSLADAQLLHYLLPGPQGLGLEWLAQTEREVGEEALVIFRTSPGVDHAIIDALGFAQAMVCLHENEALLDAVIAIADAWAMELLRYALERGARWLFDSFYNFSLSAGWSPRTWRAKIFPLVQRHAALIHAYDGRLIFYDDGKLTTILPWVIEAGADAVQTVAPPPTGDAVFPALGAQYRGHVCFWGGVDLSTILRGTPEQVEEQVREVIAGLGPTGLILGTSDSIRDGSPEANVRAFVAAGRKYGQVAKV